jgi:acylphosphatase
MAVIGRSLRLYGRVQGVFFRQWTVHQARKLGVGGWVRNRSDGSVEAHLAGEEEAVEKLIEKMRSGSPQAHVDDIMIDKVEAEKFEGFSVKL